MRIVQSFWSLPGKHNPIQDDFGRNGGGWPSERYHAMSWALSCLTFGRFYKQVELYTDTDGVDWLINRLGLPYSNVVNKLDQINGYNTSLWALAKIFTCLQQDAPFLHADGDVYIWEPFEPGFLDSPVFAQNIEYELAGDPIGIYAPSITRLQAISSNLPPFLDQSEKSYREKGRIDAINTGILGGQNVQFLRNYAQFIFDFLDRSDQVGFASSDMNTIEQLVLYGFAEKENIPIRLLFGDEKAVSPTAYSSMIQFNLAPMLKKYIHLVGYAKKRMDCCSQVELRLKYEFPKEYRHIDLLYKTPYTDYPKKQPAEPRDPDLGNVFAATRSLLPRQAKDYDPVTSSFTTVVEEILNEEESSDVKQLLSDVYQIEKFHLARATHNNTRQEATQVDGRLLDLLYRSEPSEFLDHKFTLNTSVVKTALLNFRFPSEISVADLITTIPRLVKNDSEDQQDLVLLKMGDDDMVHSRALSGWDILLVYFDGEEVSGNDLIRLLKEGGLHEGKDIEDLSIFVLSFLTINSLYLNYLKLAGH
jgi:hypothetical protein